MMQPRTSEMRAGSKDMKAQKRSRLQLLLGVAGIAVIRLYLRLLGKTVRKAARKTTGSVIFIL